MAVKKSGKSRRAESGVRYAPSARLELVKKLISRGGASIYDIAGELEVSERTAIRYVRALEIAGEQLYDVTDGRRKVYRYHPSARRQLIAVSEAQILSLVLYRSQGHLQGTGLDEYRDEFFEKLLWSVAKDRAGVARSLEQKVFDVNEAPYVYGDRAEDVSEMIGGLHEEERLDVIYGKDRKRTMLDPLTLLTYKKGLYLIAYSHHHNGIRTFGLDELHDITWRRGDKFEYPRDYHPKKVVGGAFGLIRGPRTAVQIFFTNQVARFIRRRRWHESQRIKRVEGGIELSMVLEGTTELLSWVLSWGDQAELLEPQNVRDKLAAEAERVAARYHEPPRSAAPTSSKR